MKSDNFIQPLLNQITLSHFISAFVKLEKRGNNYLGLCPFHQEKTPSFNVNDDKQFFHCFGCKESGNAINFIQKIEHLSFKEALYKTADMVGFKLDRQSTQQFTQALTKEKALLDIYQKATHIYQQQLYTPQGAEALEYLTKKRLLDTTIIQKFQLGFAPSSRQFLENHIGLGADIMQYAGQSGLLYPNKHGAGLVDRFNNKIIFPIHNRSYQVIAVGSRVLDNSMPKYIGSAETPIFKKKQTLYGLPFAIEAIKEHKTVYVTEGYFDVLAMHQFGIQNTVATMGTATNALHLQEIKKYTQSIHFMFDSDLAGQKAAMKAIFLSLAEGIVPFVISLPNLLDPCDYFFERGSEAFYSMIETANLGWEFYIASFIQNHVEPIHQANEIQQILDKLQAINPFLSNNFMNILSKQFNINIQTLRKHYNIPLPQSTPDDVVEDKISTLTIDNVSKQALEIKKVEETMVNLFIHYPESYEQYSSTDLGALFFINDSARHIFALWLTYRQEILEGEGEWNEDVSRAFLDTYTGAWQVNIPPHIKDRDNTDIRTVLKELQVCEVFLKRQAIRSKITELEHSISVLEEQDEDKHATEIETYSIYIHKLLLEEKQLGQK